MKICTIFAIQNNETSSDPGSAKHRNMKETVTSSIGSELFILDKDAYRALQSYLDEVRERLPEGSSETLADIEIRIAELLREGISSPMRVVSIGLVRETIARIGAPAEFGERPLAPEAGAEQGRTTGKLYRSRNNRSIAGVCGGIGAFFGIDPTVVRLLALGLLLCGGMSLWVYIILWVVIPEEEARPFPLHDKQR